MLIALQFNEISVILCKVIFMTKVYIVRHCQSLGNVKDLFQGVSDLDITERGGEQLKCLSERFSNIYLDKVYSSPLIRTQKTAKAIVGNRDIPILIKDSLIEINGGYIEGRPFDETFGADPELLDTWLNHPQDFAPKGGEPMRVSYQRIWDSVKEIAQENKGKTVACATHGGVIRCLNCKLVLNDIEKLKEIPIADNTGVTLIEFDDELNPKIVFMNDASHLPDELKIKKSKLTRYLEDKEKS